MYTYIFIALLGAILGNDLTYGVRIGTQKTFGIVPSEEKLEYFNAYTPDQPPPVMEDPEPENRLPQGPRAPGFQIENAVSALSYRYPTPPTTPRPGSPAALAMLSPNVPSAFARPRPQAPLSHLTPTYTSPGPNFLATNQLSPLLAYSNPDLYQQQLVQQQRQAQAYQQQQNQFLLAQQRQQQQRQQAMYQHQLQSVYIQPSHEIIQPQISSPLLQPQQQLYSTLQSSPLTQQQTPPIGGISYSNTYHISRVTDH